MDFSKVMQFKWTWRDYQARVLENAEKYVQDGKVHIVAAPGSGKTTLGIELIRRMNENVLILAPSVTIREQWAARIKEGFLLEGVDGDSLISQSMKQPKAITIATYQALHSAMVRFKGTLDDVSEDNDTDDVVEKKVKKTSTKAEKLEEDVNQERAGVEEVDFEGFDLVKVMKENKLGLLCLDECHHLRSEWWKALEQFRKDCGDLKVIALTATPPYDSTPTMWNRYMAMCGEIDEEITVPELVKEGSLCPHQDFVYFNYPTEEEKAEIQKFRDRSSKMMEKLMQDDELLEAISSHAALTGVMKDEKLYEDKEYLKAFLVYLKSKNVEFPKKLQAVAGTLRLPKMNASYMEKLLQGFLYSNTEAYAYKEEYSEKLEKELKAEGLIEKKQVVLNTSAAVEKLLINSKGKANSIRDIALHEYEAMGKDLRLLVLTDYIRKEYEKAVGVPEADINALGVLPFFEMLRREAGDKMRIAVLCGTIVVIPAEEKEALEKEIEGVGKVTYDTIGSLPETDYVKVNAVGDAHFLTGAITNLFSQGCMQIMIGTKSLLGEGWDSPCINSLILASFVGSFMLSNQMRGRAIRTFKQNPEKSSNIWHLVCLKPWEEAKDEEEISEDFSLLERRMEHFLGLHYTENTIETGLARLSYIKRPFDEANVAVINESMLKLSGERSNLKQRWNESLAIYKKMEIAEETEVIDEALAETVFKEAKGNALLGGLAAVGLGIASLATGGVLGTLLGVGAAYSAFKAIPNVPKVLTMDTPVKRLRSCGMGIRKALMNQELLQTKGTTVAAETTKENKSSVYLCGGTSYEKNLFAECVQEFFADINDQRYILVKKRNRKGEDGFYSVPECFAKRKEDAENFAACITPYIGEYELVYTRNGKGKELLLEGRMKSLEREGAASATHKVVKEQ
ncbi:MAG: DEAD/DEAH box helicase family protein [Roseburia sp.]|nr:DEAD/DEAH box helicase family protein [Roseburia sp.]